MFTVNVGTLLCLLGCASAFAVNRSTIEPDHNWKFQFPVKASTSYVESTTEIPMDLNQFTISFWVEDVTDNYIAYFSTPGRELQLYYDNIYSSRRYYKRLHLFVNGVEKYCDNCFSPGSRKHIVVTWSGTADANGVGSVWVNGGSVFSFSGLSAGSVIKKGLRLKLGQRYDSSSSYSFRGEIMYFNVYPTYVTTADQVTKLSKKATSDSEAVLSWGSFIGGANGDVVIYPEVEIFTQSYIAVTCRSSNMTLTLDRSAFPHLIPSRASLKDPSCKVSADDKFVNVTTTWASCGTVVTYNESMAYYTNYIVPDILNPPDHTSDSEETVHAVINRGAIALDESRLFLTCKYDFVPHSSIAAYAVSSSTYLVEGKGARDFSFGLKLYHDSSYKTAYSEKEYPLHADSKERVFAQAQLSSSGIYIYKL